MPPALNRSGPPPLARLRQIQLLKALARELTPLENPPAGDDDEDMEVVLMSPAQLDAALASGDEWLDGKSVTAWFRAKQLLGL